MDKFTSIICKAFGLDATSAKGEGVSAHADAMFYALGNIASILYAPLFGCIADGRSYGDAVTSVIDDIVAAFPDMPAWAKSGNTLGVPESAVFDINSELMYLVDSTLDTRDALGFEQSHDGTRRVLDALHGVSVELDKAYNG